MKLLKGTLLNISASSFAVEQANTTCEIRTSLAIKASIAGAWTGDTLTVCPITEQKNV